MAPAVELIGGHLFLSCMACNMRRRSMQTLLFETGCSNSTGIRSLFKTCFFCAAVLTSFELSSISLTQSKMGSPEHLHTRGPGAWIGQ
jgi:hypothetical protein